MLNADGRVKKKSPSRIVCIPRAFAAFRFLNIRGSEAFDSHQMGGREGGGNCSQVGVGV